MMTNQNPPEARARLSHGTSGDAIYRMVADEIRRRGTRGTLLDIGCGIGALRGYVASLIDRYVGVDVARYDAFPNDADLIIAHLDQAPWPIDDATSDITCCVETIEHLENPRQLFRELARITRPGGIVIVTTPNNLSWLSILTLLRKGVFNAFQEAPGLYPAHLTALVETDLVRIATEAGLSDIVVHYSNNGRIPFSSRHWPSVMWGRRFSDNVCVSARR